MRTATGFPKSPRSPVFQRRKAAVASALLLAVLLPGCATLQVPFVSNTSSPIRAVRVLDAETGEDIPGAWIHYRTDRTNDIEDMRTCQFRARYPSPNKADYVSINLLGNEIPDRKPDQSFPMPVRLQTGYWEIPLTSRERADGTASIACPQATIEARSKDHYWASASYTTNNRPVAGWSASASDRISPNGVIEQAQTARCEFGADGVLRFYLRRIPTAESPAVEAAGARQAAYP